ncbi:DUF1641 domain-containing protein [Peribacillus cavernae]|uniref:DUF1641 domain-containing protein n=1 Tax=Peribacillus cavernae TaxID=1674310 RepID=A0A433HRV4_9BACI|nr:DUF1641 domain-containing protein [Peribacillus cavernae]MDQ0218823.1 uncharacterized protein YjgD (DUF1641 family) [Peribacillus cavernae]RUQ31028.1 DUF1641 domain-containing protein [Peribacillus cavernae]
MAQPITFIQKKVLTAEELQQQKLDELKSLLSENEEALNKLMGIVGQLNDIGVLGAAHSIIQSKEKITKVALEQVSREPVTNLLNVLMGATGAIMQADPHATEKVVKSSIAGLHAANEHLNSNKKVGARDIMKVLNDPDINRSIGFGIHFLKGMGKALKND